MKNSKKSKNTLKTKKDTAKEDNVFTQLTPQYVQKYKPIGSMFSIKNLKNLWKHQRQFASRFFIIMHRTNGMLDLHYVYTHSTKFAYNNGAYLIDKDFMRWSDSLNCYVGEYLEDISLPINLGFDEKATAKAIKEGLKGTHVEANVNAKVLLEMVRNEAIQKLAKSDELVKTLNKIFMICIVILCAIIGLFVFLGSKLG